MDFSSSEISVMVFRRIARNDMEKFSLDSQMLAVLMELDGKKKLGEVAKETGLDMTTMREVVSRLVHANLVQPLEDAVSKLGPDFFEYLRIQLSLAVGPIAELLIEDAVTDLGHELLKFPTHRAAELVDLLGREIQREEKKTVFKQNMIQKIKEQVF